MDKAYKINAIKNPLVDADHDAYCLPFKGKDIFGAYMMGINDFDAPDRIYLLADFLSIPANDFIDIDMTFHVLSIRMLDVIRTLGKFEFLTIPVTMIDDTFLGNLFDEIGQLNKCIPANNDYIALQLKEYSDIFDYEKSIYKVDLVFPEDVGQIEKMIFKEPQLGFPPIFKIREAPQFLFVSKAAKENLERDKISGCHFEGIECS